MNNNRDNDQDSYRSFLLMSEIEGGEARSQRDLAKRLGIAVGLVNSYLKNFVAKGYVRVKAFPRNRYAYLLTPQGIVEKSRLAYQHLTYFNNLYKVTRQDYLALFRELGERGVREVAFCGVDEVAEIAYLSLQETEIRLAVILDDPPAEKTFFHRPVEQLSPVGLAKVGDVVVTSLKREEALRSRLLNLGIPPERVHLPTGAGGS